jgi:hypothetical protein
MPENKIPKLFGSCQERPTESWQCFLPPIRASGL